ncbi:MAG: menaquinone biosynthesis protein [Planctomycetes bacterium]|nr:menaquinone biosynthesis protein [Planctomycetota bacterium]
MSEERNASPVRVGGIDYLNALPLTRYLAGGGSPPLEVSNHAPSALASKLRSGELDLALAPVVEYPAREEYRVLPRICIASYGEVRSIRFYHRRPLADLRRVGLDASSRTSALLTRLLFRELWRGTPRFVDAAPPEAEAALAAPADRRGASLDGILLIGDVALRNAAPLGWEVLDLGTVWTRWTGLPFVYAFWIWRGGPAPAGLLERFERAKAAGLARVDDIVREAPLPPGLDAPAARHYLGRVLGYDLGGAQVEGLIEFFSRLESALGPGWAERARRGAWTVDDLRWLEGPPSALAS